MATVVQTKEKKITLSNGGWAKLKPQMPLSVQYDAAIDAKKNYPDKAQYMSGIYLLAGLIIEWDLVDENKKPIPINVKTVDENLSDTDAIKIINLIHQSREIIAEKKSS